MSEDMFNGVPILSDSFYGTKELCTAVKMGKTARLVAENAKLKRRADMAEELARLLGDCKLGFECAIENAHNSGDDSYLGYVFAFDRITAALAKYREGQS